MAITTAQIQQLYVAYLGRAADKAGLDYWADQLNTVPAKLTLDDLRANFVNEQPEYKAIYGGLTREDAVVKIYNNLFGRAPDADGLAYWTTGGGASVNADLLLTAFVNGAASADAQVVANKVLVSEVYTSTAAGQYTAADAKAVIADVNGSNTSVTDALGKLTDGSLSGIAVPAAVAALKADAAADAAVTAYQTNKLADISALAKELTALTVTNDKAGLISNVNITVDNTSTYAGLKAAIDTGIDTAKTGLDTKALTSTVATDTSDLATARTNYLTDSTLSKEQQTAAQANINAYDAAVKAVAANQGAADGDVTQAQTTFAAYANNDANKATYAAAVKAAGLADGTTTTTIFNTLVDAKTTSAQIDTITKAFAGISAFDSVKTVTALEHSQAVAQASFDKANAALTNADGDDDDTTLTTGDAYKAAYDKLAADTAKLNASKSVDAFVAKYGSLDNAYTALTKAASNSQAAVDDNKALLPATNGAGTDDKADVFFFPSKVAQTNDFGIKFGTGDSLYLGEGYTLGTATVDASGHLVGGNNNALEVFFVKDGTDVKAVVETTAFGSSTAVLATANATDNAAVITLTGVTDVSQVTFANGVISHVA
ncbi:DUF4214 domain-containing protein [Pseudomonas sp. UBA1879]|uniref:DUF4214 domain-containing protein n=1 Tax=Pseudomonas sp. UBA1879 TaxID=1947305 RepID=UPI0025F55DC4|nr:DUF4214 domain-containing protein [Pseudomonas sp. UBA1879]